MSDALDANKRLQIHKDNYLSLDPDTRVKVDIILEAERFHNEMLDQVLEIGGSDESRAETHCSNFGG